jgi:hypothetical protein
VITNLRTPAKVEQAVTSQSTVGLDGSYVISITFDIDGLSFTPTKIRRVIKTRRKYELLVFGYMAQGESFQAAVISRQLSPREYFVTHATLLPLPFYYCRLWQCLNVDQTLH